MARPIALRRRRQREHNAQREQRPTGPTIRRGRVAYHQLPATASRVPNSNPAATTMNVPAPQNFKSWLASPSELTLPTVRDRWTDSAAGKSLNAQ